MNRKEMVYKKTGSEGITGSSAENLPAVFRYRPLNA
jgi:hypothetical protein